MAGLFSRRSLSQSGRGSGAHSQKQARFSLRSRDGDAGRMGDLLCSLEDAGLGWFWESDADGCLTYISTPALDAIGCKEEEFVGKKLTDVLATDETFGADNSRPLKFRLSSRSPISCLNVKVTASTKQVWWEISAGPRLDASGNFLGYHGTARDVTNSLAETREAELAAQYDSLTGLANRARMTHQLEHILATFKQAKRSCAILMMDLDRFKQVNDTLGHPAGDELLVQVGDRVKRIFEHRGEIGRLGGDEFQIILPDVDDRGELGELANQLVQMISQPYSISGNRAIIGCSVGIAVAPYDGVEADELVKAADLALYSAKDNGRGNYKFYSADLSAEADFRKRIEDDLRDAIIKDELRVHYQPIVDHKTHKVVCLEALLRWEHAHRGFVSPGDFVPVAEELGMMPEIGEWVLTQVCEDLSQCPRDIRAAVNVSPLQLGSEDFVEMVKKTITASGVEPARIELEITESVFFGDIDSVLESFKKLRKFGVRLALDDFGTGYSSLSYLRNAPFNKIKIDQSFVRGCAADDGNNGLLVGAIVSMANALGMETVAEGVETKDELATVLRHGATQLQGYLFSGALTFFELLERFEAKELEFKPLGPERYRAERRTEFRKIGLIHGNSRYTVILRNLSQTGAMIDGLLEVPIGTDIVLDLGGGQLAVATVRRSEGSTQGVEFETPLIKNGADGLCTRHRVSPYQIEAAGRGFGAINDSAVAAMTGAGNAQKAFLEVDISRYVCD